MSNLNIVVIKPAKPSFPRIQSGVFALVQARNATFDPYWEPIHLYTPETEVLVEKRECLASQLTQYSDWQVHGSLDEALAATRDNRLGGFLCDEELERRAEAGFDRDGLVSERDRFSL